MPSWLTHPPRRIGFRGATLLNFALIWVVLGIASLTEPVENGHVLIHQQIPGWLRFTLWVGTAVVAAAHAFDPPIKDDGLGFAALFVMPAERAASYLWGWAVHVIPGGEVGAPRGWVGAIVFLALCNAVLICSRWREPQPVPSDDGTDGLPGARRDTDGHRERRRRDRRR